MNASKKFALAVVIVAGLAVAVIATTASAFFETKNVSVLAQASDNATASAPSPTTGQEEQQPRSTNASVYITKDSTNSYIIPGDDSSSSIGSFDTTYRITGKNSAIQAAGNLIVSTVIRDFNSSATIGYVRVDGTSASQGSSNNSSSAALPNPFASNEMISQKITDELRQAMSEAESDAEQNQEIEIMCRFGMTLDDIQCHYISLLG